MFYLKLLKMLCSANKKVAEMLYNPKFLLSPLPLFDKSPNPKTAPRIVLQKGFLCTVIHCEDVCSIRSAPSFWQIHLTLSDIQQKFLLQAEAEQTPQFHSKLFMDEAKFMFSIIYQKRTAKSSIIYYVIRQLIFQCLSCGPITGSEQA